jgi:hypothetical protein
MTFDKNYLQNVEKAMKLMAKHAVTEMQLPDGTKLVRPLQAAFLPKQRLLSSANAPKASQPINDPTQGVDIRFAAVSPTAKNDFARYRASSVLRVNGESS